MQPSFLELLKIEVEYIVYYNQSFVWVYFIAKNVHYILSFDIILNFVMSEITVCMNIVQFGM